MSYSISKHTDDSLILTNTRGMAGILVSIFFVFFGLMLMTLAVGEWQESGEWPVAMCLFGAAAFLPVFRFNKVVISAKSKDLVQTQSWFGVVFGSKHILNEQLSLIEISGLISGEFAHFLDPSEHVRHSYSLTFFSHPKLTLTIATFSDLLKTIAFFEAHFDTNIALLIGNNRHKFTPAGLMEKGKPTPLPQDGLVRQTGVAQLSVKGHPLVIWMINIPILSVALLGIWMLHFQEEMFRQVYIPPFYQYALSACLIALSLGFVAFIRGACLLTVENDMLTISKKGCRTKHFKLADVWGVSQVTNVTYLLTKNGAEKLAYKLPDKHNFAIHSWLTQFIRDSSNPI